MWLSSKFDQEKERISKPEDRLIEIIQYEEWEEKNEEKMNRAPETYETISSIPALCIRSPGRREEKERVRKIIWKINGKKPPKFDGEKLICI